MSIFDSWIVLPISNNDLALQLIDAIDSPLPSPALQQSNISIEAHMDSTSSNVDLEFVSA